MKSRILLIIILTLIAFYAISQPPCTSNPVANDFCSSATPICNLNGYCGNTSATYTNWVSTTNHTNETNTPLGSVFCATIQNNSWLKFIADSTVAVFNVWCSNCQNNHGIQMQIYSTTDCYNFVSKSNCWNPGYPTNGTITATNLIPGQVYYFMIDGTQGDVCDYVIAANVGVGSTPTLTQSQSICKGDSATLVATGGSIYAWTSTPVDPTLTSQASNAIIKVKPLVTTTYSVSITKAGSNSFCPNNITILTSIVTVKPLPILTTSSINDHCGIGDGKAIVIATGGTGTFNYAWNTNPVTNNDTASNLHAGQYTIVVTDANGCKTKDSVKVLLDTVLNPTITGPTNLCSGSTITLNAGSEYTTYLWSTGATTSTISVNTGGSYYVNVTKNGCSGKDTAQINLIIVPTPNINGPPFICKGDTATLNAGNGYATYHWSNNKTTQTTKITSGGTYSVTVTDANSCSTTGSITIIQKFGPTILISSTNETCNMKNGTATAVASGGQGTYNYLWNNGQTTSTIINLSSGTYSIKTTDSLCSTTSSVVVNETPGPIADFSVNPSIQIYNNHPVNFIFNNSSSGNISNWYWDFGDGSTPSLVKNTNHNYIGIGQYQVTLIVSDGNGCTDSTNHFVVVRDIFAFYIPDAFTPNGDGVNDYFTPKGYNVDPTKFKMYIYDRWGKEFYHTTNWNGTDAEAWNGTLNNSGSFKDVVMGVYIYRIILKEIEGPEHEYSGKIILAP